MEIKYKHNGSNVIAQIHGELDECSAVKAKSVLDQIINDNLYCNSFIFDLSELTFMDSTGIGLLIGRYKKLKQNGIPAYISGASIAAEKVIELAGLYKIMPKC